MPGSGRTNKSVLLAKDELRALRRESRCYNTCYHLLRDVFAAKLSEECLQSIAKLLYEAKPEDER